MKKKWTALMAAAVLMVSAAATGCAPTEQTVVQRAPDFSETKDVALDFIQLHNDTIECFGDIDENPYVYILDVNVDGDNDAKTISVDAICMDDTTKEEAEQFIAAVLRHANDSAVTQSTEYHLSSQESFGDLFDKYALTVTVRPDSTQEDESTYLLNLDIAAGGEIPLNPDIETYEEEWLEERDRIIAQMENGELDLGDLEEETEATEAAAE